MDIEHALGIAMWNKLTSNSTEQEVLALGIRSS
jgi:hypothetical protein